MRTLHTLGLAHLFARRYASADQYLKRAKQLNGGDAVDSDLAAALIGEGLREQTPRVIAEGLEILLQHSDPPSAEWLFNKAVGLEALGLQHQALTEWHHYTKMDLSSEWGIEARQHILQLHQNFSVGAATDPQDDERAVLDSFLPSWAEAALAGHTEAARVALDQAQVIAAGYEHRYHDHLLTDIVTATQSYEGTAKTRLARSYSHYADARRAYQDQRLQQCRHDALDATHSFVLLSYPAAQLGALTDASCAYLQDNLAASKKLIRWASALNLSQRNPSVVVSAQIDWLAGLLTHADARPLASLSFYNRALSAFQRVGDEPREARVHSLVADLCEYLGRTDAAWEHATLAAKGRLDPGRRYQALSGLVRLAATAGFTRVAALIANAALDEAIRSRSSIYVADAQMELARVQAQSGDRREAISMLEKALATGKTIPDRDMAHHALAYARIELAAMLVEEDPARAAALINDEPLVPTLGELAITAAAVKAESYRRQGLMLKAERELRTAIKRSRRERRTFSNLSDRDLFFTRRETLHHQLVLLLLDTGRNEDALDELERWRTEASDVRRESEQATSTMHLSLKAESRQNQEFYAFLALPKELLVWRLTQSGTELSRHTIAQSAIANLAQAATADIRSGKNSEAAAQLSKLLFGNHLNDRSKRLVVAPDANLFGVPFGALPIPGGDEPLLAHFEVEVTTSLRLWARVKAMQRPPLKCLLIIQGASTGGSLLPGLSHLTHLPNEVHAIAKLYQCVNIARTRSELNQGITRHPSLIHYTGHALSTGRTGAALLLNESGRVVPVEESEIEHWNLRGATILLSSCSGADGRPSALAGRDGLARAFLAAGARSVIANLWPVEDESASELVSELHKRLSLGESVGQALRFSQRELFALGRSSAAWGGWMLIGAD